MIALLRRRSVTIESHDIARMAQALQMSDDLADDFLELVRAYEVAASVAQRCGEAALADWLALRAGLHREHQWLLRPFGRPG